MKHLDFAPGLRLPADETATQKFAFIGRSGSGKTYAAGKLVELLIEAGSQVAVVDPVGIWHGLRLAADGKAAGLKVPILGGQHGDIPLEPTAGALIADLVVDRRTSLVLDVSEFLLAEQRRFVQAFATQLLQGKKRSRSPLMCVWEESQEFVPERATGDVAKTLGAMQRLIKIGRNFGIGTTLITQRPQAVSKDVLNQCEPLCVFQTTGPHERKAVTNWIVEQGLDAKALLDEMPSLAQGEGVFWSPQWLRVFNRFRCHKKKTFDASATPTFSGTQEHAAELPAIDLDQIRTAMKATIEKAKAEDPRELKRTIAELRAKLAKQPTPAKAQPAEIREVPVVKDAQIAAIAKLVDRLDAAGEKARSAAAELRQVLAQAGAVKAGTFSPAKAPNVPLGPTMAIKSPLKPTVGAAVKSAVADGRTWPKPHLRILDALAWLRSVNVSPANKVMVALMADQSPTSSSFANNMGALRSAGLVAYPAGGLVELTHAGSAEARPPAEPPSTSSMHASLQAKLPRPQWRILEVLINAYPDDVNKLDVAAAAEASPGSSSFANNLGALRSLGLIEYSRPGNAKASPVLFLPT